METEVCAWPWARLHCFCSRYSEYNTPSSTQSDRLGFANAALPPQGGNQGNGAAVGSACKRNRSAARRTRHLARSACFCARLNGSGPDYVHDLEAGPVRLAAFRAVSWTATSTATAEKLCTRTGAKQRRPKQGNLGTARCGMTPAWYPWRRHAE